MTCTIIGVIVNCLITTPPPSPAEAAAILAPGAYTYRAPDTTYTPGVFVVHGHPQDGPYGRLRPFFPTRRLDGTLTDYSWPTVYGRGFRGEIYRGRQGGRQAVPPVRGGRRR